MFSIYKKEHLMNRTILLKTLILFCVAFIGILFYNKHFKSNGEGFAQNEKFVLAKDDQIYDDFYCEIYDTIHTPHNHASHIIDVIQQHCIPSLDCNTSTVLDIGSGTGELLNELMKRNIEQSAGIEKSQFMTKCSLNKYPNIVVNNADVNEPLSFDAQQFTHAFCTHYTIYHFADKKTFFRNCYKWIKPSGCLVIHLVDKEHFKTSSMKKNELFKEMIFNNFNYKINYDMSHDTQIITKETFTDKHTGHIRQNEFTLWFENKDDIVKTAKWCGFNPLGFIHCGEETGDFHQYLFFFERTL